jgi:multicomponent K+:H+ antiporter subunit D
MLDGAFAIETGVPAGAWLLLAVLLVSGLATLIALVRLGVQTIWATEEEELPRVLVIEMAPVVVLIGLAVLLTVRAGSVMDYLDETASMLARPDTYVEGVFSTPRAADQDAAE